MRVIELTNKALSGASYNWSNFAAARVTWQQLARDQDETAPYIYKEPVRVAWDGVTILEGTIRKCALEQSGNAWRWSLEACDILQPLEAALCIGDAGRLRGSLAANFAVSSGSADAVPRKVSIAGTLKSMLEAARKHGLLSADVGIVVDVPQDAWMWDSALGCDMYAAALRKVLGHRPGMVMWVEYPRSSPVIHVADGSRLPVAELDRVRDRLTEISITHRHDLVPPAVGVVMTAGRIVGSTQAWPPGADLHQEGAITVQMAMGGDNNDDEEPAGSEDPVWDFTRPVVEVRGVALPEGNTEAARKWWLSKIPELAKCGNFTLGKVTKSLAQDADNTTMSNYSTAASAQRYEHVSGQLSEACKTIKWSYVNLKQLVYTYTRPPASCEAIFTHSRPESGRTRYWGWLPWRGRTINTNHRKYRASKQGDSGADGGGEPPGNGGRPKPPVMEALDYSAVLKDYYNITRAVPSEGSVRSLCALSPAALVGCRLSLSGARSEYRTMATVVQGLQVDLDGETTSISTGVPVHLSLQDMIDRVQQLAQDQHDLDDEDHGNGPTQTLTYDHEAYNSPPAPTIGPEGQVVLTAAPDVVPGYGFECRLNWDDDHATVTGCRIRPGNIMLNGNYIATAPQVTSGEWYESDLTAGDVWLDVKFNNKGKLTGTSIAYEQGAVNPLRLQSEEPDSGEVFSYSFHLATLKDKEVIQHMLGTIQIPVYGGTYYPYGPAI